MIVAMEIESILREFGCMVVGPIGRLGPAVGLARNEALDAAILDVNVDGENIFPVTEELEARDIPFALATGYDASVLPKRLQSRPYLSKPFTRKDSEKKSEKHRVG